MYDLKILARTVGKNHLDTFWLELAAILFHVGSLLALKASVDGIL